MENRVIQAMAEQAGQVRRMRMDNPIIDQDQVGHEIALRLVRQLLESGEREYAKLAAFCDEDDRDGQTMDFIRRLDSGDLEAEARIQEEFIRVRNFPKMEPIEIAKLNQWMKARVAADEPATSLARMACEAMAACYRLAETRPVEARIAIFIIADRAVGHAKISEEDRMSASGAE